MLSVIFENAQIIDGTGAPAVRADLALANDRIALVGSLAERESAQRIDAGGKIIAPGFIDVHSHSDELWLALPRCDGKIAQGVTTEIAGNCGSSVAPLYGENLMRMQHDVQRLGIEAEWRTLDDFFGAVERNGIALNAATLVGLGTTRRAVAGESERKLDRDEIAAQAAIVREACEQGAVGVSSGLIYPPSSYADLQELVAMARAGAEGGAPMYASHVRSEGDEAVEAIQEALAVGEGAHVRVECSHHKASGKKNWGKVHDTLALIDAARDRGLEAYCDVYPYIASWTGLATMLPDETRFGGPEETVKRLRDPQTSAAIALHLNMRYADEWNDVLITEVGSERNAWCAGKRLDDIARERGVSPARATIELLADENLEVGAIFFRMNEDDVATVLSADFCCIGSDASARALLGPTARGVPHPRTFGTFPRVFRRFVRERKTIELAEAVRRMTSLPASIFNLRDRGIIAPEKFADLVIFDPDKIADTSTYESPYSFPAGIDSVYVNGQAVLSDGNFTNALPGRVLRHGG